MRRITLLSLLFALAAVAPAAAQDAKPVACAENLIEDASGDPEVDVTGLGALPSPGGPELDITKAFFSVDGAGVISGNIEIANLAKKVPGGATGGVYYYFFYVVGGAEKYVVARVSAAGAVTYRHGVYDANLGTYTNDSEAPAGKFIEGPSGVVSIPIPAGDGVAVGQEVSAVRANVDTILGQDDEVGLNSHADEAPNGGGAAPLKAEACTGAGASATPVGSGGTIAAQPSTLTSLPFRGPAVIGRAAKAKKGKTLTLSVEALSPITNLSVTVKASSGKGATLASGKLSSLKGKGKLKLKLKRALKKGRYALLASGVVDGKKLRSAQQVGVR